MTGKQDAGWTEPRIERLKQLWPEGLSATEIAKVLGGGLTRCAVLGKVHRLGLRKRPIEVFQTQPVPKVKKTKISAPATTRSMRDPSLSRFSRNEGIVIEFCATSV